MKHSKALCSILCVPLALLTACAPPQPEALAAGTISRRPAEAASAGVTDPEADHGLSDLRCADLREIDLSDMAEELASADFDTRTQWPEALPEGFDPERLLEQGKDPGLGLRALHERGITGKGVGIAIIDQALLVEHQEYADRLRLYQEYHTAANDDASTHGPAVASIALGETVGVAPEALLYFIADDVGHSTGGTFVRDMTHYAEDVDRLVALNEDLPEGEKIRAISMSVGWMPDTPGAKALEAAIRRARDAGIAVICVDSQDPLLEPWMGMGRTRYGDPDSLEDCRPGAFWEEALYNGNTEGATAPSSWSPWTGGRRPPRRGRESTPTSPRAV